MNIRLLLFIFLSIYTGYSLHANEFYFRHYNNKQGLSHNTVYCSFQDDRGFMWFGTEDGINRFDGHTFKVYRHNSYQPYSLPNNIIHDIYQDSAGTLWICTARYVCTYDEPSDSFIPFSLFPEGTPYEYFSKVREDKSGNLWFINSGNIIRYSPENKTHKSYTGESHFYPSDLSVMANGTPVFSGGGNIYVYQPDTDRFTTIPILSREEREQGAYVSRVCDVPELGILAGSDRAGLKLYTYHNQETKTIIPDIQVRAITPYNAHTYWIGSESGIYIYHTLTGSLTNLTKSLVNEYTLSDNAVYSITKDREDGMWAGCFFGGISYLPRQHAVFNRFIGGKTHPQLLGNAVREICPDQYGNLWLGTEDNGINRYNLATGEITNYSLRNSRHPLSATNIHGLYADGADLWIGTYNKGIEVMDIPSGKIVRRYSRENNRHDLPSDFILCFNRTKNAGFLIGTSLGIAHYDKEKDRFTPWKEVYGLVRQIYEDSNGIIWAATTAGIYKYVPDEDKAYHYTADIERAKGLGSISTTSVFEDSRGGIWVTTINGISFYNPYTDSFNRITTEDGLPSNIVYRILEDKERLFWVSTANGLVRFNPENYTMRIYSHVDGLHEPQFNYSSAYKSPEGIMYMGTINGMISFDPSRFTEDTYSPPVEISQVDLPGKHTDRQRREIQEAISSGQLKLPYNKATFTLSYIALSYTYPEAIQYAYMLEGIDHEWIPMNRNREVTFANLSPGKYVFKVKSTNSSGVWQDNQAALQIIIVPPFWATPWAFLFYALMLCVLIGIWYYYKKQQLIKAHKHNQERFEARKEKELYNAKIQFFTFITHEIRTPLTLIKAPLEKIIRSGDGTVATRKGLQLIEKNTHRLLDLSNQLLDFRKTESKGFKLNFVETDIVLWIESILNRYRPSIEKENKQVKVVLPESSITISVDRDAFTKIMDNLLSNAVKYSDRIIILRLEIEEATNHFTISVLNDGMIIPESEREKIFTPFYRLKETENMQGSGIGLSLASSLTDFHNGTLKYEVADEGLNCFTLDLPLRQEESYQLALLSDEEGKSADSLPEEDIAKPTLLVVEDQTDMRRFIAAELSEEYSVLEARNGKIALEVLKEKSVQLIVSDVMMPVMDGFDFCNKVKNNVNYSHIPFIILTAQHNLQSRLQGLNNGADAYIEKPFSVELLHSQIKNLFKSREILSRSFQEKPQVTPSTLAISRVDELFLDKLNDFLEVNLNNESLNVELLAAGMNMSTSSLYRKVKGLADISPVDFIRIFRLKKAVELMEKGENRINEVAYKTGFSSPAYFSTCFQKQYGKSPSDFMKAVHHKG